MNYQISGSIVIYKNDPQILIKSIESFLDTQLKIKLFLIDNSPTDALRHLVDDPRIEYIFNNKNVGFGKAHNIAINSAFKEKSLYHVVINPDIYFDGSILNELVDYLDHHDDVAQIMPKILYPNGKTQYLCKLLPSPIDLFLRRFLPWFPGVNERNRKYELEDSGYDRIMNIPYLSGCFMFFRTSVLREIGLFDERIFMYIEDADLTRRIHRKYKTVFYPRVVVYHHYHKGSYKNFKLMLYNIHGAFIYFNKWGWFLDPERRKINQRVISTYLNN